MTQLPNFLIVGAAKAGTTSLCHYLSQHPEVLISAEKEPRFFCPEFYTQDTRGPLRSNARTEVFSLTEYLGLFETADSYKAVGEATTEYLYYPQTAQRIRDRLPNVKLIAILRNPVERAFSAYCYQLRDGCETQSFAAALQKAAERETAHWRPGWLYPQSGYYYAQLKRYYDIFPSKQIQVHLFSDFKHDPAAVCKRIFDFLAVDPAFSVKDLTAQNVSKVPKNQLVSKLIKQSRAAKSIATELLPEAMTQPIVEKVKEYLYNPKPTLAPELKQQLISLYTEDILALENLIDRNLSEWLRP